LSWNFIGLCAGKVLKVLETWLILGKNIETFQDPRCSSNACVFLLWKVKLTARNTWQTFFFMKWEVRRIEFKIKCRS
jgi:hypothetical protein